MNSLAIFGCVFFFCGSQSKHYMYKRVKAEPRSKQNMMGRGQREKYSEKNCLQINPLKSLKLCPLFGHSVQRFSLATQHQPVSGCQIPRGYKLDEGVPAVVMLLT